MKRIERIPALSAIPAITAMVPVRSIVDGNATYTPVVKNNLPSRPTSSRNIAVMAGIAALTHALSPEIEPGRPKKPKTGGRLKGTPNRTTTDIRQALRDLAEGNASRVQEWLDRVSETDPAEALRLWLALLRFVTPTLQAAAITDVRPKSTSHQLAAMSDQELLAIIHSSPNPPQKSSAPILTKPNPDTNDEELLR